MEQNRHEPSHPHEKVDPGTACRRATDRPSCHPGGSRRYPDACRRAKRRPSGSCRRTPRRAASAGAAIRRRIRRCDLRSVRRGSHHPQSISAAGRHHSAHRLQVRARSDHAARPAPNHSALRAGARRVNCCLAACCSGSCRSRAAAGPGRKTPARSPAQGPRSGWPGRRAYGAGSRARARDSESRSCHRCR